MKKLILILMSTLLLLSPALGSEGPAIDQDIKDFTSQYIDLLNQSLADLEVKEEILDYYHQDNYLDLLALKGQIGIYKASIEDASLSDFSNELTFTSIERDESSGNIKVTVEEENIMYYSCNGGSPSETWIEYVFTIEDGPHGLKILSEDGSSWIKEMLIGEVSDHIGLDKTAYPSLDMEDPRLQNQEVKDQAHDLVYQMVKEEEEAIGQLYNELGIEENIKIDTENDQGEIFVESFDQLENNDNTINLDNYHLNSKQNTNFINSIRELLKNMHINMY